MRPPGFLEALAAVDPAAPAVFVRGQVVLDHASLAARARAVAARVAPDTLVALDIPRSPELVAAMIGTWMGGAAFLVLSAADPPRRRAQLLAEALPHLILRTADVAHAAAPADPAPPPRPGQLAYVVYTSGSTGAPKGVLLTHDGLPALIAAQREAFALHPRARALWMLSPSFDASISDVTTTLAAGGALCLEDELDLAPERLLDLMAERAITHVDLPPSLLTRLDPARAPPSLETIVIGGEPCPQETVRAWADRVRLVNVYGPSEATVCTSLVRCTRAWDRDAIGEPLPGVVYTIVDEELWIAGPALARGYLARPDLDAARFVHGADGLRYYRTGDRVRRDPDGALVFAGRLDRQVKLHGQRIELEEIERVLRAQPGVAHAAVVKVEPAALVAFVVAPTPPDIPALRRALAERLPPYMIPARIEQLDALPITTIGKVDHAALVQRADQLKTSARPTTDAQPHAIAHDIAAAWRELLGQAPTPDDDFFAAGGDSIAALSLAARLGARGYPITPSLLYLHPTPSALAAALLTSAAADVRDARALETLARVPLSPGRADTDPPRVVLLTGATGTLGRALLARLLHHTDARIIVTARARTPPPHPRVEVLRADLERERLGLDDAAWSALAARVDTVVHAAARVNLAQPYEALARTNVAGTRTLLALGARFHHISTLSVFVGTDRDRGVAREDDDLTATARVWGGYAQSKWVAERLVRNVDPHARIHRLGLVIGAPAPHELLATVVRGLASLGCAPAGPITETLAFDVTPLDHAADLLARLVACAPPGTYHLANARSSRFVELLAALERALGRPLARVPEPSWATSIAPRTFDETAAHLALARVSPALHDRWRTLDLFQATGMRFDDAATRAILGLPALLLPPPDAALVDATVRAILETGRGAQSR